MITLANKVRIIGSKIHFLTALLVPVLLLACWTFTLDAFGKLFQNISGQKVLDLMNVQKILSAEEAYNVISIYSMDAKILYWVFFVMDNVVPLIAFASLSLIWVNILKRYENKWIEKFYGSIFILIPWGVGFFDTIENLFFVSAISSSVKADAINLLNLGLIFVNFKAFFLILSFNVTFFLLIFYFISLLLRKKFVFFR